MTRNSEPECRRAAPGAAVLAVLAAAAALAAALATAAGADEPVSGAAIFAARCAVCHGPEAGGIPGSFPSLHEQIVEFGKTPQGREYLVMVVTTGLMGELHVAGVTYRGVMPAQSGLSDAEIAAVLSYLAANRGQDAGAPALTGADVAAIHARHPNGNGQSTRELRPALPTP